MRVALITSGSRGDLHPFLSLANVLKDRGHEAVIGTHLHFQSVVEEKGLSFHDIGGDPVAVAHSECGRVLRTSKNPFNKWRAGREMSVLMFSEMAAGIETLLAKADCCIYGVGAFVAGEIAERKAKPHWLMSIQPMTSTGAIAAFPFQELSSDFGPLLNKATYRLTDLYFSSRVAPALSAASKTRFWPRPKKSYSLFADLDRSKKHVFYAFSPTMFPPPVEWGEHNLVTGFWESQEAEKLSPQVLSFLDRAVDPIYLGFGGGALNDKAKFNQIIYESLGGIESEVVLLRGINGFQAEYLGVESIAVDYVPLEALFKRVGLAIHHGGAGTCFAAIKAGVPSIVIPMGADNALWGRCIERSGVGITIPQRSLTSARLREAIEHIKADSRIRKKVSSLSRAVEAEDGASIAASHLESLMGCESTAHN